METRFTRPTEVELRAEGETTSPVLTGYAVRYNSPSLPITEGESSFVEIIQPGAFTESLTQADVVALAHHDDKLILGRQSANTLKLVEDEVGLRVLIYPPANTLGVDIVESVRRGDLSSMSFGFFVTEEEFTNSAGVVTRHIKKAEIFEVSIVVWAAYPSTSIKVRSDVAKRVEQTKTIPLSLAIQMLRQIQVCDA